MKDPRFHSDWLKETIYHEMSHASHYSKVGTGWYSQFVNAELAEIVAHPSGALNPYGDGHSSNSPIIALGEGWAYHIGHSFTDKYYGMNSDDWGDQGMDYHNGFPIAGLSSHLNLLENFNHNSATDHFKWIPTGLFYDMIDARNDATAQIFNALQSDVTSVPSYKARLQQNPGNQTTQITDLELTCTLLL